MNPVLNETSCIAQKCVIYIAGDIQEIKEICRTFVTMGLCVSVVKTDYIYTGGEEEGASVTLINYPRFVKSIEYIQELALELARRLLNETDQLSATVISSGAISSATYLAKPEKDTGVIR